MDDRALFRHIFKVARESAVLGCVAALIALALPRNVETVIVGAIAGTLSTAMWKLLSYPALGLLGLAFVTSGMRLGRPFRWCGTYIAGLAFNVAAACFGIFIGILPAITFELGARGFFAGCYLIAVAVTGMGVLRMPARILYGFVAPELLSRRLICATLGAILAGTAFIAFCTERWPELS